MGTGEICSGYASAIRGCNGTIALSNPSRLEISDEDMNEIYKLYFKAVITQMQKGNKYE